KRDTVTKDLQKPRREQSVCRDRREGEMSAENTAARHRTIMGTVCASPGSDRGRPSAPVDMLTDRDARVAVLSLIGIALHLGLRFSVHSPALWNRIPLMLVLLGGGIPLVLRLVWRALHGEFGADHLAAVSIVASTLLDEYLAGAIVVLMLSG